MGGALQASKIGERSDPIFDPEVHPLSLNSSRSEIECALYAMLLRCTHRMHGAADARIDGAASRILLGS